MTYEKPSPGATPGLTASRRTTERPRVDGDSLVLRASVWSDPYEALHSPRQCRHMLDVRPVRQVCAGGNHCRGSNARYCDESDDYWILLISFTS